MIDWDDAYANAAHIPGGDLWPAAWRAPARAFRQALTAAGRCLADLAYGPHPRHRLDLFVPPGTPLGLMMFVHGGYWLALDKSYASHFAGGALARGYAVAVPSYRLCPEVRIAAIAEDVAAALDHAAAKVAGPIVLVGHSAGGQLAARLATDGGPLAPLVRTRLARVVPISGLHDLRPLMATRMNLTLQIDPAQALRDSPALQTPLPHVGVHVCVGAAERPAFIAQSRSLAAAWPGSSLTVEPGRHHFDILDELLDPGSPLCRTMCPA